MENISFLSNEEADKALLKERLNNKENLVIHSDNLEILKNLPDDFFQLIYIDPPFNTGHKQTRMTRKIVRSDDASRRGYQGKTYSVQDLFSYYYDDKIENFNKFLMDRIVEAKRILHPSGTLYLHLDYREVHYAKVILDCIFGRENFLNEIIWAYDYGGKPKKKWPAKHDNILVYVKDRDKYYFNQDEIEREPYMAPGLVTEEQREKGKMPTDVWWHTIVSPTGREKTGYPTQKPEGILRRIVAASSKKSDYVLDFFAGSGTAGDVAMQLDRKFILIDSSESAIEVIKKRFDRKIKNRQNAE